ncbi:unnamed protein product [Urochloa humidicola]
MATRCRSGGRSSSSSDDEAATSPRRPRRLKRKPSAEPDEAAAATARRVRSKCPPASASVFYYEPPYEVGESVILPPSPPVSEGDDDDSSDISYSYDEEAAAAEFGRMFPDIPPRSASSLWAHFVSNAKACIEHYNNKCQADFVYKHASEFGMLFLREPDGSYYYHMNFHGKDKKNGQPQLFFGEIRVTIEPKEEDVSCCCPVSESDAGGKRLGTIAESISHK